MELDKAAFEGQWLESGESQSEAVLDTAWRRYRQINPTRPVYADPTLLKLKSDFSSAFQAVKSSVSSVKYVHLPGNKPPWKATGLLISKGQSVTVLPTGRIWRSQPLDLWLGPQFGLWYRLGENGTVFNSTAATITFTADEIAELYVGTQFPGQYGDRNGRVLGPLRAYDKIEGSFEVVIIVWQKDAKASLQKMVQSGDPHMLPSAELQRMEKAKSSKLPEGWHFLWFLGISDNFIQVEDSGARCIHCSTQGNVGILQKELVVPLCSDTVLDWEWLFSALPSRLREDTTVSHDYLSIVAEFENGRDLTYTWSWELEVSFGYWCPLATWCDREYHIVIRSGTEDLGHWLAEKRNVYEDYRNYIREIPPQRIVRIWLIAGSRWQRNKGEMTVKNIRLTSSEGVVEVL